jgi:hypothetical protein
MAQGVMMAYNDIMRTAKKRTAKSSKRDKIKRARGKPLSLQITPELLRQYEAMASLGLTMQQIALVLGVSERTIAGYNERFQEMRDAYDRGRANRAADVAKKLSDLINKGDKASIFFYLKCQCGWRETQVRENTGPEGGPQKVLFVYPRNGRELLAGNDSDTDNDDDKGS